MSDQPTIEAYGINDFLSVDAANGLLILRAEMQGGAVVRFALDAAVSSKLRPMLRDAERIAGKQLRDSAS